MCFNFTVSLSVGDATQTQTSRDVADSGDNSDNREEQKSGQSFLTVTGIDSSQTSSPTVRSTSPTCHAVRDMESGVSGGDSLSAIHQPVKDGEEIKYHGYTNPHKQSRSFKMLEQGLRMSESGQGVF